MTLDAMLQLMFLLSLSRGTEEAVPTMVVSGIRKLWISSRGVNGFYIEMLASSSLEKYFYTYRLMPHFSLPKRVRLGTAISVPYTLYPPITAVKDDEAII